MNYLGWTTGDIDKELLYVKSVPNAEPNADGEWVHLFVHKHMTRLDYLTSLLPKGQHAVAATWSKPT